MAEQNNLERIKPTEAELKARRKRNVAIAVALIAFVVLVYLGSIFRIGPALFQRGL